jgi:predicted TIM-barrel fold metal-dependent hydrolase
MASKEKDPDIMQSKIIDFHTHIFPTDMAAKTLEEMDKRSIPSYSDGTLSGLIHSMDRAGIDISVASRITTRPEQVESTNEWLLSTKQARIHPLATWHPDLPVNPDIIRRLGDQGFKGFKLHPDYQGFIVDEEGMFPFYEAVQTERMFILFHAGLDRGLPGPLNAPPERLLKIHEAFPELSMILAHMGGEEIYDRTEKCLLGRDIYLDTSFVLRKMPIKILERFLNRHPIERFLFGTDNPWVDQDLDLKFFLSLPFLKEAAKEKIISTNAARLLGTGK